MNERDTGMRAMDARVKALDANDRTAATELGLVAALIVVAIAVALAATGGPIIELAAAVLG
jgi:hypothetical protein